MPMSILQEIVPCITIDFAETGDQNSMSISASCRFPVSFTGFQGHFPNKPILPAIIQLTVIRHLLETVVKQNFNETTYKRAKFKSMVFPEEKLHIRIDLKQDDSRVSGKFKITNDTKKQVSGGNFAFVKVSP